jgi:hypothetical protein
MMKNSIHRRRAYALLAHVAAATALAAIPAVAVLVAPMAGAQVQQKPADGRALDANNRIGSGGTNTFRPDPQAGVLGNQIINGNVTAGKEFHGKVDYTDRTAFRGPQPNNTSDNFVKNSVGVGVPNAPPPIPNATEPYYTANRFAPPAQPGFVPNPIAPGYIPQQPIVKTLNDSRLGAQLDAEPMTSVPKPGEMFLPGPVDPTSRAPTLLSASPLTGIRQFNPTDVNDLAYLHNFTGLRQDNVLDRAQVGVQDLERMRAELRMSNSIGVVSGAQGVNGVAGINGINGATKIDAGNAAATTIGGGAPGNVQAQNLARPVGQPFDAPSDPRLTAQPLNSSVNGTALTGNVTETQQGQYSRLLGAPEKQSTQYNELKKRLEQYQTNHKTPAEVGAERFNAAVRAKKELEGKAAAAAKDLTNKNPDEMKAPGSVKPVNPNQTEQVKPSPLSVKSMTTGVQGQGLKDLLAKAEGLLKDGKYTAAIDQYAAAEQVAPNQPLIWIGRANAELGAAYYKRAEDHLKQAFRSDEALLMAQYDLRSFLGEDRLQSIIKDLKEVAGADDKSPTPVFLLAYVAYNTGNERRAAAYLDLAEKRSDGKDPIYKLLREHWSLPPAATNPAAAPGGEDGKTPDKKELNK